MTSSPSSIASTSSLNSAVPSWRRQLIFAGTGGLAGLAAVPIEATFDNLVAKSPRSWIDCARSHAPALVGRAAIRFWIFDHVKHQLDAHPSSSANLPVGIKGGLSGACGGLAEVTAQSFFHRSIPTASALGIQFTRLFCAFGTYTALSTRVSDNGPPRPFAFCWLLGACAGGVAGTVVGLIQQEKMRSLFMKTVPKSTVVIGTIIAVQVTTSFDIMKVYSV